ncbi:MAG: DEAD/DEAH box helicase, partial [Planctomycetales bacterium]
ADLTLEKVRDGGSTDTIEDELNAVVDDNATGDVEIELPVVQTTDALAALDSPVFTSADKEAVEFLTTSAAAKLWKNVFHDEAQAVAQAEAFQGGEYATQVRDAFLMEYRAAKELEIPPGYAFTIDGVPTSPNLMQRLAAVRVRDDRRVGNWSGTGAGKTLSAVLASRVIGAQVTIICCPNSVVDGWRNVILDIYPHSHVATKDFHPDFDVASDLPCYLIFNYEAFQQPNSAGKVRELVDRFSIAFIVVDEIHYSKQREADDMSRRRQMVTAMIQLAGERSSELAVLGMSATPVINNLQEGRSLIELITGVEHADLSTRTTVSNCMRMHQQLVRLGIRWMPEYDLVDEEVVVEICCEDVLDEVRELGRVKGSPLALEQILTLKRLPVILEHVRPKTLIYTHYVQGIDRVLREALEEAGWKTGFYTGDDKSGLEGFLHGDVDVLIGSSAIGTGVDGLQRVCNRLIINVLPWTAAAYEQLKGRSYRQGQTSDRVQIVVPVTHAEVNGERWSWCESKRNRLKFKKSVADAAVDGVVPEGHLRTPAHAFQDVLTWLERLDDGEV